MTNLTTLLCINICKLSTVSIFFPQEQSDLHLKDYDSEIFDDDDFYHQVINTCTCKPLIHPISVIIIHVNWVTG